VSGRRGREIVYRELTGITQSAWITRFYDLEID
jgi:hypothetical protein